MSQSLAKIYVHLIFSTKHRQPWLHDAIRPRLHSYLAGIFRDLESQALEINSEPDHIHALFVLSRTRTLADTVRDVKRGSSLWLKSIDGSLSDFQWQNGYGAFSVSESKVPVVSKYIQNQKGHHRRESFQVEFRRWLNEYRVEFDERYVWD